MHSKAVTYVKLQTFIINYLQMYLNAYKTYNIVFTLNKKEFCLVLQKLYTLQTYSVVS